MPFSTYSSSGFPEKNDYVATLEHNLSSPTIYQEKQVLSSLKLHTVKVTFYGIFYKKYARKCNDIGEAEGRIQCGIWGYEGFS